VAQKLHDTYNFSYDNLQVLLGGWNTWNQEHAKDPAKYPEGGTAATPGASGGAPAPADSGTGAQPQVTIVITPQP